MVPHHQCLCPIIWILFPLVFTHTHIFSSKKYGLCAHLFLRSNNRLSGTCNCRCKTAETALVHIDTLASIITIPYINTGAIHSVCRVYILLSCADVYIKVSTVRRYCSVAISRSSSYFSKMNRILFLFSLAVAMSSMAGALVRHSSQSNGRNYRSP